MAAGTGDRDYAALRSRRDGHRGRRLRLLLRAGLALATGLKGKTPDQTFYSILYAEAKKTDGIVTQTSKGTFKLNPKARTVGERKAVAKAKPKDEAAEITPDPKPSTRKRRASEVAA